MKGPYASRRSPRRATLAALGALAAALLWPAVVACRPASAETTAAWAAYRAAAHGVLAASAPRIARGSALGAAAVRWPHGGVLAVDPGFLRGALNAPASSWQHRMAIAAMEDVAAAPPVPTPPPSEAAELGARLDAILRQPAFAGVRPGLAGKVRAWAGEQLQRIGAALASALGWLVLGAGRSAGRIGLLVLGACAAAAAAAALVLLARAGLERSLRGARIMPAAGPSGRTELEAASAALAAGDPASAVRAIYRAAVSAVSERTGVRLRPGWTAADIRRAARLDARWPNFARLGDLHAAVVFDPGARPSAAEAASWLEEVERWSGGQGRGRWPASRPPFS